MSEGRPERAGGSLGIGIGIGRASSRSWILPPCLLALLLTLLCAPPVWAEVLTLAEVEARALATGDTRGAAARIAQSDADVEIARSARRPVVSLNTDVLAAPGGQLFAVEGTDKQRLLVQGSHPLGEAGAFTPIARFGSVLAAQATLLDFGRATSRIHAGEARARAAELDANVMRRETLRTARDAYLLWTVAYARAELASRHGAEGKARAAAMTGAVSDGSRPSSELNAVEQDTLALAIDDESARAALAHARVALEERVGGPLGPSAIPDLGLLEADGVAAGSGNDPGAAALAQESAAAAALAESLSRVHAPILSTSAEVGLRGQGTSVFPAYRVGLLLTVPLWDGGLGAAQARSQRAQADALDARAESTRKSSAGELRLAEEDLASAARRLELAARLRRLAQAELDQTSERYRLGAVDLRGVFEVRDRLWRAESQELTARADRTSAWLRTRP
jgi:outer membrane protein TolC